MIILMLVCNFLLRLLLSYIICVFRQKANKLKTHRLHADMTYAFGKNFKICTFKIIYGVIYARVHILYYSVFVFIKFLWTCVRSYIFRLRHETRKPTINNNKF